MTHLTSSGDMAELYQALILDHNRNPRNFGNLENPTYQQEGHNPVCGDHYFVSLKLDERGERIEKIAFSGAGCAISKASASIMTTTLQGKTLAEADHIFQEFHQLLTRKLDPVKDQHNLGKLQAFASIWKYPARVKCAGLAWHTLKAAIDGGSRETVKTE